LNVRRALLLALAWSLAGAICAAPPEPAEKPGQASAGGRLSWDFGDALDLLGDIWVDQPHEVAHGRGPFFSVFARTAITQARSDIAFLVRDVDYELKLGYRDRQGWFAGLPVSLFVAQKGKLPVDRRGRAAVRWVGIQLESPNYRRLPGRGDVQRTLWDWRVAAGPVFEAIGAQAAAVVQADASYYPRQLAVSPRLRFGIRGEMNGQIHAGAYDADWSLGPILAFPVAGGRKAGLFVQYRESHDPLGIGHSAVVAGFEYAEGSAPPGARPSPPEVGGRLAMGAGESNRVAAEFLLRVLLPPMRQHYRFVFTVDANVLTGETLSDLFYLYHLGLERSFDEQRVGVYFYHRSNHQIDSVNDTVTSLNVLELGWESADWHRAGRRSVGRLGGLDARARAGWLIDSSFGEDRRWHLRGGLRWTLPWLPRLSPYLAGEVEYGDVERSTLALGFAPLSAWEFQLEQRHDDQWFDSDQNAWLVSARYGF